MSETNEASVQSVVHIPGPWKVAKNSRSVLAGSVKINQQAGPAAQSAAVEARNEFTLRANAKLIAASPEMLRIIQRLATADWIGEAELNLWRKECREIISKAV